jgi:hypothetical protein
MVTAYTFSIHRCFENDNIPIDQTTTTTTTTTTTMYGNNKQLFHASTSRLILLSSLSMVCKYQ